MQTSFPEFICGFQGCCCVIDAAIPYMYEQVNKHVFLFVFCIIVDVLTSDSSKRRMTEVQKRSVSSSTRVLLVASLAR